MQRKIIFQKRNFKNWESFLLARDSGDVIEVDEEMFEHWRDILPPIRESKEGFYFAEGLSDLIHFWREPDQASRSRYFCQNTYVKNQLF